jgi:hypothetical protein
MQSQRLNWVDWSKVLAIYFSAPNEVDKYLDVIYGDWKAIPSVEHRETHNFSFRFL